MRIMSHTMALRYIYKSSDSQPNGISTIRRRTSNTTAKRQFCYIRERSPNKLSYNPESTKVHPNHEAKRIKKYASKYTMYFCSKSHTFLLSFA